MKEHFVEVAIRFTTGKMFFTDFEIAQGQCSEPWQARWGLNSPSVIEDMFTIPKRAGITCNPAITTPQPAGSSRPTSTSPPDRACSGITASRTA